MRLRNGRRDDVDVYLRLRCDPAMMTELGGPQEPAVIPDKVERDVRDVEAGKSWITMITRDDSDEALGTVMIWSDAGTSEIGWMVLPEHQGRGVGKWVFDGFSAR